MTDSEQTANGGRGEERTMSAPPTGGSGETISGGVTGGLTGGDGDPIRDAVIAEDWGVMPAGDGPPEVLQGTVPGDSAPAGMPVREADSPGSTEAAGDPGPDA